MEPKVPSSPISLVVAQESHAQRLDTYLHQELPTYSRSFFKRLIEDGYVTINDQKVTKASAPLKQGDSITIQFPRMQDKPEHDPSSIKGVEILFEHEHFLVINKPAGLVVHKGRSFDTQPTLVDWLVAKMPALSQVGDGDRPGIVHRLDKDTSGIILVARTNYGHNQLSNLFKNRKMQKTYWAIVEGHPSPEGVIDFSIGRHPGQKHKMTSSAHHPQEKKHQREAVSHYKVLQYFDNYSLVEIKPVTGRTHQIRVHMAAIGHPLLGDNTYNPKKTSLINRQALHAKTIAFPFNNESFLFEAPLASDFAAAVQTLAKKP